MHLTARLLAGVALALVSACSKNESQQTAVAESASPMEASQTLADAMSDKPDLGTLGQALKETGLATVFDGTASYTLLAPTDEGFTKLGEPGKALLQPEQRAALAAIVRAHVLPGYFTPKDIEAAIAAKGGAPVEMRSMGNQTVRFAKEGNAITVTSEDGIKARLSGQPVLAGNGVALPVDAVLKQAPQVLNPAAGE